MPKNINRHKSQRSFLSKLAIIIRACTVFAVVISLVYVWHKVIKPASILGPPAETLPIWKTNLLRAQLMPSIAILNDAKTNSNVITEFVVISGENAKTISERLATQGIVPDANLLTQYMIYKGIDSRIQSGYFQFSGDMNTIQIAHSLTSSIPSEINFYVWPGWRREQLAQSLARHPHLSVDSDTFLAFINRDLQLPGQYDFINQIPPETPLEGYLYPGNYIFSPKASESEILNQILTTFDNNTSYLQDQAILHNLTLHELVTLASIVQRELVIDDEAPKIASVFFNRLSLGMPLAADATTQYALANSNNWWPQLSIDPRLVESPYNTYVILGLPPGPICNPSANTLESVTKPEHSDLLYFRAACDNSGRHNFSYTYEQHLAANCN
ncbi:MAG TPA: endolytic transglycosylase MltG [Chloroflexi bacterium]|nr:endolytic transglycosylase MltG [Chloroflexota bacterium]